MKTTSITSIIHYADTTITTSAETVKKTTAFVVTPIHLCTPSAGKGVLRPQSIDFVTLQLPQSFLTTSTKVVEHQKGCFVCARELEYDRLPRRTSVSSTVPRHTISVTPAPRKDVEEVQRLTHESQPTMSTNMITSNAHTLRIDTGGNIKSLISPRFNPESTSKSGTTTHWWGGPLTDTFFSGFTSEPSSCEKTKIVPFTTFVTTEMTIIDQDPNSLVTKFSKSIGTTEGTKVESMDVCEGAHLEQLQNPERHLTTHKIIHHGCFPPNCKRELGSNPPSSHPSLTSTANSTSVSSAVTRTPKPAPAAVPSSYIGTRTGPLFSIETSHVTNRILTVEFPTTSSSDSSPTTNGLQIKRNDEPNDDSPSIVTSGTSSESETGPRLISVPSTSITHHYLNLPTFALFYPKDTPQPASSTSSAATNSAVTPPAILVCSNGNQPKIIPATTFSTTHMKFLSPISHISLSNPSKPFATTSTSDVIHTYLEKTTVCPINIHVPEPTERGVWRPAGVALAAPVTDFTVHKSTTVYKHGCFPPNCE